MFPQRPMPPMNSRGFVPPQSQFPIGRQPMQGPFQNSMMGRGQFGPQMPVRGGGGLKGLLSRIMPGSQGAGMGPQGFIQGASGASRATGALQGLTNPANISGMLGNVQKVLGMAQQVTPMVQQYGPLVKNLPAMIKIYRELKNSDGSENSDEESVTDNTLDHNNTTTSAVEEEEESLEPAKKHKKKASKAEPTDTTDAEETTSNQGRRKRSSAPKSSKPKMYI